MQHMALHLTSAFNVGSSHVNLTGNHNLREVKSALIFIHLYVLFLMVHSYAAQDNHAMLRSHECTAALWDTCAHNPYT